MPALPPCGGAADAGAGEQASGEMARYAFELPAPSYSGERREMECRSGRGATPSGRSRTIEPSMASCNDKVKRRKTMVKSKTVSRRRSRRRDVILRIVQGADSHPTAEWVYERARRKIPNLSLGTVYRNLNLL